MKTLFFSLLLVIPLVCLPSFCKLQTHSSQQQENVVPSSPSLPRQMEEDAAAAAQNERLSKVPDSNDFYRQREALLRTEANSFHGADIQLTTEEKAVNRKLMAMKRSELDVAFNRSYFPPSQSLFISKEDIDQSKVFQFLKKMPKGGALHTHDISIASADWVIANLTYRPHLWMCFIQGSKLRFQWSLQVPRLYGCQWSMVENARHDVGPHSFDKIIKKYLIINVDNPAEVYPDYAVVWPAFLECLNVLSGLLSYEPVYRAYFHRALVEFHADNVQFVEIRTILGNPSPVVCRNLKTCDPLSQTEIAALYKKVNDQFVAEHDDFCGAHFIYAPIRFVDQATVAEYLVSARKLMNKFPDFFLGFDLVGPEEFGGPLIDFTNVFLDYAKVDPTMKYFFHAGETDWEGQATDTNVLDAILLNATRIGHGYAIAKHPEAKKLAIQRDIPMEICPISNQLLGLVSDLRNHPGAAIIQEGKLPVIISSDDPGTWDLPGSLSYDFYEAFMGLAGRQVDLRFLKKLVQNSIKYAGFSEEKKERCKGIVEKKWDAFLSEMHISNDIKKEPTVEILT